MNGEIYVLEMDYQGQELMVLLTGHYQILDYIKPYIQTGAGHGWYEFEVWWRFDDDEVWRYESDETTYLLWGSAGVEFGARYNFTAKPYVGYLRYTEEDGDDWVFGIEGSYWFNNHFNAGLGLNYDSDDEVYFFSIIGRIGFNSD